MKRLNAPAPAAVTATATPRFAAALGLTSASTMVAMLAYSGPLGNAPTLATALSASRGATTWILSSMSVGLAVSLLTAGALADDFGRRRVFALGGWVFAAGSVLCALSGGPWLFVAGRLVQGVGAAGLVATGLGLVSVAATSPARRAATASWWGVAIGAGVALGPLVTGLLDLGGQWRLCYWLLVAAGAAVALASSRCFAETATVPSRRVDVAGVVTMTAGLALLLVALVQARQGGLGVALACGVAAVLGLAAFALTQMRGRAPMVDPALLRRPDFVAATVAALATGGGVIALMSFACTFLVTGMGLSTFGAGGLLVAWSGTSAVSALLARRLPAAFGGSAQLVAGLAGVAVGMASLTALSAASSPWRLLPGLLLTGIASGVLNAGLGRQAVASVPPQRAALGTGTNNTARYVGSSVGVTVVSVLAVSPDGAVAEAVAGWNVVAVLTAAVSLAGAAVVGLLARSSGGLGYAPPRPGMR